MKMAVTRRCEVLRIGDRDFAGQIRVIQSDENSSAWKSGIWIPRQFSNQTKGMCVSNLKSIFCYRRGEKHQISRFQRPRCHKCGNGATPKKKSMDSGAQCIIVQRQAPLPCKVNQEQCDKRVRSWPGRFPRDKSRQYHSLTRRKAIPIRNSTCCARSSRRYSMR